MDSGANYHVTPYMDNLDQVTSLGKTTHLYTCTREKTNITGIGSISLSDLQLNDVFVVPTTTKNLLSVNKLIADNLVHVHFSNNDCVVKVKSKGCPLVKGKVSQGMHPMMCKKVAETKSSATSSLNQVPQVHTAISLATNAPRHKLLTKDEFLFWHYKLGHPSDRILNKVLHKCNFRFNTTNHVCEACQYGKSKKLPFAHSVSHASSPFELVHTDLWGPSPL